MNLNKYKFGNKNPEKPVKKTIDLRSLFVDISEETREETSEKTNAFRKEIASSFIRNPPFVMIL